MSIPFVEVSRLEAPLDERGGEYLMLFERHLVLALGFDVDI